MMLLYTSRNTWSTFLMETETLIKEKIGRIQRRSGTPVYKQLERNIEDFINTSPDQTYFPSEREIARILNIHRKTVSRALTPFFESGKLKSTGKGTFTCRESADPESEIHELNFMTFSMPYPEKRKLRVLSYENIPMMMETWGRITRKFERRYPEVSVEMDYHYPKFTDLGASLFDWLANSEYDIVQLPVALLWARDFSPMFAKVPPALRRLMDSPEFRIGKLVEPVIPSVLDHCCPINFGCRSCSVNLELLKRIGIRKAPDDFRELFHMLMERKDSLPFYLADHPKNIIVAVGRGHDRKHTIPDAYRDWFGTDDPDETGLFRSSCKIPEAELLQPFLNREVLIYPSGSGCRFQILNKYADFPIKHYFPVPDDGCFSHFAGNLFAVTKSSPERELAAEFLAFLYETENQESFAECGLTPARISCDPVLVRQLGGVSLKDFRAFAAAGRERVGNSFKNSMAEMFSGKKKQQAG